MLCSTEPGLVLGFHGCERDVRDAILSGNTTLFESKNDYDWLGHGIYFWMSNYERAMDFARNRPGKPPFRHPAVLGAVLNLGNCLDLLGTKGLETVRMAHEDWALQRFETDNINPANKNILNSSDLRLRNLDCSVLENLHRNRKVNGKPPYDSVRGVFVEGKPIYEGAGIYDKTHVQICIRNPNCMLGFFLPRERTHWPR